MSATLDLNTATVIMRDLVHEDSYGRAMVHVVGVLAQDAKQHAPVEHGDYRDGIVGRTFKDTDGWHAALVGTNFKTVWIEKGVTGAGAAGDINFPAHRVFLGAAQRGGLNTSEGDA